MRTTLLRTVVVLGLLAATTARADAAPPGWAAEYRDDFDGAGLDAGWTLRDGYAAQYPADTANHASFELADGHLTISFPGGAEHNAWWLRHAEALRTYEGSGVYEIKVESDFTGSQQFGLSFESSPGTFMHFMLYADNDIRGYVERFVTNEGELNKATVASFNTGLFVPNAGPYYIRVAVDDDADHTNRSWVFEWSVDGIQWNPGAAGVFETADPTADVGEIQTVGVFAGNQPWGFSGYAASIDYFSVDRDPPPLVAPVVEAAGSVGRVDLGWDEVLESDGYRVRRATSMSGPFTLLSTPDDTAYIDLDVTGGTTYFYRVSVLRNGEQGPYSETVSATPIAAPAPPAIPRGGLALALDASDLALPGGARVDVWPDASGAGMHAWASGVERPRYVASGVAGRPSVRFDGVDDHFDLTSGFENFTDGISMYVVAKPSTLQNGFKMVALGNGPSAQNVVLGRAGSSNGLQYFTTDSDDNARQVVAAGAVEAQRPSIYSVLQGAGQPDALVPVSVQLDGDEIGSGTAFVPPVQTRSVNYIGRSFWNEGWFAGDVAEILLYDRELDPAANAEVLEYLAAKYGFELPQPPTNPDGSTGEETTPTCDRAATPFADVDPGSFAAADIACIYDLKITTGTGANTFSPRETVTREQMAAFLGRMWLTKRETCGGTRSPFVDVERASYAAPHIDCVHEVEITKGTGPTTYSPALDVTREQMAAFIARMWRSLGGTCATGDMPFEDVAPDSYAYDDIVCIHGLGITTGTSATEYSPRDVVTREQMAAFLGRLWQASLTDAR